MILYKMNGAHLSSFYIPYSCKHPDFYKMKSSKCRKKHNQQKAWPDHVLLMHYKMMALHTWTSDLYIYGKLGALYPWYYRPPILPQT